MVDIVRDNWVSSTNPQTAVYSRVINKRRSDKNDGQRSEMWPKYEWDSLTSSSERPLIVYASHAGPEGGEYVLADNYPRTDPCKMIHPFEQYSVTHAYCSEPGDMPCFTDIVL